MLTRSLVTFITTVAALYFTYWARRRAGLRVGLSPWLSYIGSLAVAALIARYVWRHTSSTEPGFANAVIVGALVTGGIGFAVGFFGPMIFIPGANQGPLLGIFITGPLGAVPARWAAGLVARAGASALRSSRFSVLSSPFVFTFGSRFIVSQVRGSWFGR